MHQIKSADVTERLVGITPAYLNKFIQQGLYEIGPSVRQGKVRAKRRIFSRNDVFGIALAWLLFEAGLRTKAIRRIMNDVAGTKKANANQTARRLIAAAAEYLVVAREPRRPGEGGEPEVVVHVLKQLDPSVLQSNPTANILVIPIGKKFADIRHRLDVLFPEAQ